MSVSVKHEAQKAEGMAHLSQYISIYDMAEEKYNVSSLSSPPQANITMKQPLLLTCSLLFCNVCSCEVASVTFYTPLHHPPCISPLIYLYDILSPN